MTRSLNSRRTLICSTNIVSGAEKKTACTRPNRANSLKSHGIIAVQPKRKKDN